jgi:hypothetical protein
MLLGTIYLPQGMLCVGANSPVADLSAYTIVVAGQFPRRLARLWF